MLPEREHFFPPGKRRKTFYKCIKWDNYFSQESEKNAAKHGEGPPIEWTGMETENEPSNLTVDRLIGPLGYPTAPDPSTRI